MPELKKIIDTSDKIALRRLLLRSDWYNFFSEESLKDYFGNAVNPVSYAAASGNLDMLKYLLDLGALDYLERDALSFSLESAMIDNDQDIFDFLLLNDHYIRYININSVLCHAASCCNAGVDKRSFIVSLLKRGASLPYLLRYYERTLDAFEQNLWAKRPIAKAAMIDFYQNHRQTFFSALLHTEGSIIAFFQGITAQLGTLHLTDATQALAVPSSASAPVRASSIGLEAQLDSDTIQQPLDKQEAGRAHSVQCEY